MKIEFTSLYRITLELVTEWNLDPDNSRKYLFFFIKSKFCFHIYMCINSKETCFSQKYQKWICLILELNSSIVHRFEVFISIFETLNNLYLISLSWVSIYVITPEYIWIILIIVTVYAITITTIIITIKYVTRFAETPDCILIN